MDFDRDAFAAYFKKHKLASKEIVDEYMIEHDKELYHFEDVDAVYQRQVEVNISGHHISISSRARLHNARAGGGTCTISGLKYGHHYQ